MTDKDQSHDSTILKYMMQDFSQLTVRAPSTPTPTCMVKAEDSSDDIESRNAAPTGPLPRAAGFGTSSLFLTDYEKHDWLGYGQRYRATQDPEPSDDRESAVPNEMDGKGFSLFPQDAPTTPVTDRSKGPRASCPDSGYESSSMDTFDVKENIDPCNIGVGASFVARFASSHSTATSAGFAQQRVHDQEDTISNDIKSMKDEPVNSQSRRPYRYSNKPASRTPLAPLNMSGGSMTPPHIMGTSGQATSSLSSIAASYSPQFEDNGCHSGIGSYASERSLCLSLNMDIGVPSRYLQISNVYRDLSIWHASEAFKSYGNVKGIFTAFLESEGILFLEYYDIRHAMTAARRLYLNPTFHSTDINVAFCSKALMVQVSPEILLNDNVGILAISLTAPRLSDNDMLYLLTSYGDVRSFQTESDGWPLVALVEYYDTRDAAIAKMVLQELHNKKQMHCQISFYQMDRILGHRRSQQHPCKDSAMMRSPTSLERLMAASGWICSPGTHQCVDSAISSSPAINADAGFVLQRGSSPSVCSSLSEFSHTQLSGAANGSRHSVRLSTEKRHRYESSHSNVPVQGELKGKASVSEVQSAGAIRTTSYADAAMAGVDSNQIISTATLTVNDKRTTFMIRNIPNKYTQQMLLECINETHFGKFDFLYLRMDFKNKCNVGYAFINFINTEVVASFVEAHVGKKWSKFNSDKICSLSYAAVQGRQVLIDKFRNSSIMNEEPSYRPKIFYTCGLDIGQEEPFPEPNMTKSNGGGSSHGPGPGAPSQVGSRVGARAITRRN